MRRKLICLAIAAMAWMAFVPREARACGRGAGGPGGAGLALALVASVGGMADVGLSLWDLGTVLGAPPSAAYGTVELVLVVPQLLVGVAGMTQSQGSGFFAGYTLWMAALTAHGIWSIAAAGGAHPGSDLPPDPNPPPDPSGGTNMVFGPTYVPLGPLAQVGFGLSGRF